MTKRIRLYLMLGLLIAGPASSGSDLDIRVETRPKQGALLVAHRSLRDPNFGASVVLIVNHDVEGTLGVVINRPSGLSLGEAAPELKSRAGRHQLYWGGPVLGQRIAFIGRGSPVPENSLGLMDDWFFGGQMDELMALLDQPPEALRVFVGHAGWRPGQLAAEIARKDWYVVSINRERILNMEPTTLWQIIVDRLDPRDFVRDDRSSDQGLVAAP